MFRLFAGRVFDKLGLRISSPYGGYVFVALVYGERYAAKYERDLNRRVEASASFPKKVA